MSAENEALTRRWFDEVWNGKSAAMIDEIMTADCIAHGMGPNGGPLVGPAAFKEMHATLTGAFPDMYFTLGPLVSEGDKVACNFVCEATHQGDHLGIAATGESVRIPGMTIARFEKGKLVEGWNCVDFLPAFQKIGLVEMKVG